MADTPHDAVGDSDTIAGDKARIGFVELCLDMGKEGAPLSMANLRVPLSLLRSVIEAEENHGVSWDKLAPRLNYPVDKASLLPVGWIIVAFLDAYGTKNGSELLHVSALVADDRQLTHLSCVATSFTYSPTWQADSILIPLRVAVVQEYS